MFVLQHYTKAIQLLQPLLSNKDKPAIRIALIAFVVFVSLELLRGHFKAAQIHLQNGLKVLGELHKSSVTDDHSVCKTSPDPVDYSLVRVFSRLRIQVELFQQSCQVSSLNSQVFRPSDSTSVFHSFNEAWQQIEKLLNRIIQLTEQTRNQQIDCILDIYTASIQLRDQQNIRVHLAQRFETYETSREKLQLQAPEMIRFHLLHEYHTMVSIMVGCCLCPEDESLFDSHIENFVSIIDQSVSMWKITTSGPRVIPSWYDTNMSHSIIDIGWIPPLYYTALKCRVHRVRLQAIRLIESATHREGIWDSKIAASVARRVLEIEENDFYADIDTADNFLLSSSPEP
jgi:hypothetical protein